MKLLKTIFFILTASSSHHHFSSAFSTESFSIEPESSLNELDLELNDSEKGDSKVSDEFQSEGNSFEFQRLSNDLHGKSWNLKREKMSRLSAEEISISFMKHWKTLSCGR
jgi:hypothetical protein